MWSINQIIEYIKNHKIPFYIGIGIVVIILLVVVIGYYRKWQMRSNIAYVSIPPEDLLSSKETLPQEAGAKKEIISDDKVVKIVVFYAPWCHHCREFLEKSNSMWNQLKQKYSNRPNIIFDQVNCDAQPDMATKYQIKELPTILKFKQNEIKKFEGDRVLSLLETFIDGP